MVPTDKTLLRTERFTGNPKVAVGGRSYFEHRQIYCQPLSKDWVLPGATSLKVLGANPNETASGNRLKADVQVWRCLTLIEQERIACARSQKPQFPGVTNALELILLY